MRQACNQAAKRKESTDLRLTDRRWCAVGCSRNISVTGINGRGSDKEERVGGVPTVCVEGRKSLFSSMQTTQLAAIAGIAVANTIAATNAYLIKPFIS